ncbi:Crp/Fnr family transcriptional regulator [Methylobacterium haplocladii]|uniref:Crp/Fnr family transcriptional regulator n=1 Tax=Methylobacterium haplocladii TaxID=1176176 RepID=UPI001FCEA0F6|nr:Crp/Fnr family transcriptional regulator [Methylobacterium haplocladii]
MQPPVRNRLLRHCEASDFARLEPHLVPIQLDLRQSLISPNEPIDQLVFPESGFVSIVTGRPGRQTEIGLIGNEGVVGAVPVLLAGDRTPDAHFVQAAGHGLSIGVEALRAATEASKSLEKLLLSFIQTLMIQTAQTAYANLSHTLDTRLARWLLMCQDRLGGSELAVTHEFLGIMLGVQRSSVTVAIQMIEGNQLIRARRGRIEVLDRPGLEAAAGDSYGLPEAEYTRLIGDSTV